MKRLIGGVIVAAVVAGVLVQVLPNIRDRLRVPVASLLVRVVDKSA